LKDFIVLSDEGTIAIVPLPVANSPFMGLFDATSTDPRAEAFRDHFLTQVATLALPDMDRFFMEIPAELLPGESVSGFVGPATPEDEPERGNYLAVFEKGAETDDTFRIAIEDELVALGSSLTPEHIVKRAMTRSCAGCHEISGGGAVFIEGPEPGQEPEPGPGPGQGPGPEPPDLAERADLGEGLKWGRSLGFVHVSEEDFLREPGEDAGERYGISDGLKEHFLPHRKQVLEKFLAGSKAPSGAGGGDGTLGGRVPED
jgi:hypothetical protein